MHWIVQENLYNEYGYTTFLEALDRFKLPYTIVKPVPFTNRLLASNFKSDSTNLDDYPEPELPNDCKMIAMGTLTLCRIAKERGWKPGSYLNDNFNFRVWCRAYGYGNVLNWDAVLTRPSRGLSINVIRNLSDDLFVRPVDDSKAISGTVMRKDKFLSWMSQMSEIEEEEFQPMHKNTEMLISSAKPIQAEYRMFVVNGKVVTGSLYKRGSRVYSDANVDKEVIKFTQWLVDNKWQPAKAFVIDIADTNRGLQVIEINNINSAGFYKADCQKIVMALEEMENDESDY